MNNNEWITDRLPTYADARRINATHLPDYELYGEVWVWQGQYRTLDWELVKPGTPGQPITTPEPYYKPKRYRAMRCGNDWGVYRITKVAGYTIEAVHASGIHSLEAAERIAAIYEEVQP